MAYGMYAGPPDGAETHLAPLRAVGPPAFDTFGPVSYYDLQQALGNEIVYGLQLKWRGGYFRDGGFSDDAFASIVDAVRRQPSGFSMLRFDLLGGEFLQRDHAHAFHGIRHRWSPVIEVDEGSAT